MNNNNAFPSRRGRHAALALAAAWVAVASSAALAAPGADQVRQWASACANCHGTAGKAPPGSPVPGLAGQSRSYLVEQMQAFKSGKRDATVMQQIAKGYSDEQIAAIAAWFAAVK